MSVNKEVFLKLIAEFSEKNITLVAVSKTKPVEDIRALYDLGQRDFGENYVQELKDKYEQLPKDIRWHFIGHLQSNKVKYIAPFVHLIHGVDSYGLLKEINKQGAKNNRVIDCLLQVHIAKEETKFGLDEKELEELITRIQNDTSTSSVHELRHVKIAGLMGMASFSDDTNLVRTELKYLKSLFDKFNIQHSTFNILSMGMSADYQVAIEEGSNMVRIGSLLFGSR